MDVGFMTGLSHTNWSWATRLADLNNDGLLDVFVTNGHARDNMNADVFEKLNRLKEKAKLSPSKVNEVVPLLNYKNLAFLN